MKVEDIPKPFNIDGLTASWLNTGIRPNQEYQRGSTWKPRQKQLLIDSIFRGYPLPRFYFEKRSAVDPLGNQVTSLEVIDGQQRLIALSEYVADKWATFDVSDEKIPLPPSIRRADAPWAGKRFSQLSAELQEYFKQVELAVVLLTTDEADEVRDLFIRLQSGTPLTAQQVRDAWPGNVGPFIESLAGKTSRIGDFADVFAAIDRRGVGGVTDDEFEDRALDARQTCAQLLVVFLAKEKGRGYPSIRGDVLNDLYHQHTDFDPHGRSAKMFRELLQDVQAVIRLRPDVATTGKKRRKKTTKNRLISLFLFMRLLRFSPINRDRAIAPIAKLFWDDQKDDTEPRTRVASAETLENHFSWFVNTRMAGLNLPELDMTRRLFSEEQKDTIWEQSQGLCGVCQQAVERDDAEYDHIKPWILGGKTDVSNGRPVHPACHARGLAAVDGHETPQAPVSA